MILLDNELNSQNIEEFESLLSHYKELKASRFMEIGSLYGWTLRHFIYYSQEGSTGISVDLPVRNFVGPTDHRVHKQEHNYKNVWPGWAKERNCKLYLIPDNSLKETTVSKVKEILGEEKLDFLFIDGDHRYEAIKSDFQMYSPLVRKGGLIGFHDIGVNEEGGGNRFWNEIKSNYEYTEILKDTNKEKGIGILKL
jgi:cephalosporin hydroxylase